MESCAFVNLNEISVFPGEQEILMAPGGIFQVQSVLKNDDRFDITLKFILFHDYVKLTNQKA